MVDNEKVEELFLELSDKLDGAINALGDQYSQIRAGRANPHILDNLKVEAYGGMSRMVELGNVNTLDARTLVINLWDKSLLKAVEKAILQSNIGVTPTNDGNVIRLSFPELTEETRKNLAKQAKKIGEDAKVAVRNVRRDAMDKIKKMKTAKELSEDEASATEADIEKEIKKAIESVEKLIDAKTKDIMTI
ncbi:MAG: ribosome recycling factor [Clostridia bacterium]|nr:ribosome recycling factor [Clostridia bacterium]